MEIPIVTLLIVLPHRGWGIIPKEIKNGKSGD